jgi:hypothetical protein
LRTQRKSSIDFGEKAALSLRGKARQAPHVAPPPSKKRSEEEAERGVPPHVRAYITFQSEGLPVKEWITWFADVDTERSIERRARNVLDVLGCWRRLAYWRDQEGIRLVMTNSRKETELKYYLDDGTEVSEIKINEEDTPQTVTAKVGKKDNYFVVDANDEDVDLKAWCEDLDLNAENQIPEERQS